MPASNTPQPDIGRVAIIGTGLLGASVGLALRRLGLAQRVIGVGRTTDTLVEAQALGAIDEGTDDYAAALADTSLCVIAVPLSCFGQVFRAIAPHDHVGLIITDVGSTKASVHAAAAAALPDPSRFVGSHPMAGSEKRGPSAASADLLPGKPCIVTTEPGTNPDAAALVEGLWAALGMRIIRMSAADHDRQTAAISHLPHAAAVLLVQVAAQLGGWDIASTGFRDTTRLASSNPPMRADILTANRAAMLEAIDAFAGQLDRLRTALDREDHAMLLDLLNDSQQHRDQWLATKE
ncbi:MAG: prephenate dehydrogenase/arogenate dehydrogenase family protein [Planctomycetes bacterium]|jgi:prephenate dehydrogenase|nr:prephenate dehydrogenase/arogenate dehydrogenase family protein [Planctomycetota bacterium]